MQRKSRPYLATLVAITSLGLWGCSSLKTPATVDIAVSGAAVDSAASAGASQYAPDELSDARIKLARARQALKDKEYQVAMDWAAQAQADAKLAQGKANSIKAEAASTALQDDIRVLREELERTTP